MNILLVGRAHRARDALQDAVKSGILERPLLILAEPAEALHHLEAGSCDLCLLDRRALTDNSVKAVKDAAMSAAVPLVLVVEKLADLDIHVPAGTTLTLRFGDLSNHVFSLADMTPVGLALALRSIIAEAKARRDASNAVTLFQLTQETLGVGTWDWDLSTGQVIWSDNLYQLFGVPHSVEPRDLFKVWLDAIHPDDQESAMSAAVSAMAGLAPLSSLFRIRKPSAEDLAVTWRWIACKGVVLRDPAGRVVRLIGINVDVTEQQEAAEAARTEQVRAAQGLEASEARFRAFFEGSSDCMFHLVVWPDGRFTYADINAVGLATVGLSLGELLGREPLDVLGPIKGAGMTAGLRTVLSTGQSFHYEPTWVMATGRVTFDAVYMPLRDRTGSIVGILGVARDVTERRAVEDALRQARKVEALGQLAAGVAHDFNNILQIFQSGLQFLAREVGSENGLVVLTECLATVDRGRALTTWLTGFVQHSSVVMASNDLNAAMDQIERMLRQALPPGINVVTELSSDLVAAKADSNEVALAVLNLGLNARDAMSNGGTLRLVTRNETVVQKRPDGIEPGSYAVIEIVDTGKGMAPEILAHVLEPFFTTKPAGRGTGLGLPMVNGIVRRAGGGLRISSTEAEGTRVSLFFPASETPSAVAEKLQTDRSIGLFAGVEDM